jgi:hypothetical protein
MITFGEKTALDAYSDFCKLQQNLINQLLHTISVMAANPVAFAQRASAKTEYELDQEFNRLRSSGTSKEEIEDALSAAGFSNTTIDLEG